KEIMSSMGLIVPGVSSFGACVEKLKEKGLFEFLQKYIESGKKYLGICLGYQLLFESSEESPGIEGLCIFKGTVKRFGSGIKVPHIGWNTVQPVTGKTMFKDVNSLYYYFVHSYYVEPNNKDIVSGYTDYGINFASSIEYQNIWACQFHPEKSSASGLQLLRNFVRWCEADD
ncbi:MAG: imidazole glycerol phosphate synthase subunit HisH, partial [Actinobacteria bacterium]|nr:imidazole glycerol phosphate synthase subunit HisH [Actinomycetota bacterium]